MLFDGCESSIPISNGAYPLPMGRNAEMAQSTELAVLCLRGSRKTIKYGKHQREKFFVTLPYGQELELKQLEIKQQPLYHGRPQQKQITYRQLVRRR
jgi:hypothetical protein